MPRERGSRVAGLGELRAWAESKSKTWGEPPRDVESRVHHGLCGELEWKCGQRSFAGGWVGCQVSCQLSAFSYQLDQTLLVFLFSPLSLSINSFPRRVQVLEKEAGAKHLAAEGTEHGTPRGKSNSPPCLAKCARQGRGARSS